MASRQLDLLAGGAKSADKSSKSRQQGERRQIVGGGSGRGGKRGGTAGETTRHRTPPADASLASEAQRRYLNYARQRHHVARAARRARRPQAGAAPHPLRDVREPAPLPGRQAPEVRDDRRRGAGQVPPARRHVLLRRDGAHGAAVLDARPAGRRPRQLRLARRRRARRLPLHRGAPGAAGDRAARRDQAGDGRLPPELRRHDRGADRPAGEVPAPAGQRLHRASRSAWRPTSRRTTWARCARRRSR